MTANASSNQRLAHIRRQRERAIARAEGIGDQAMDESHPLVRAVGLDKAKAILSPEPTPLQVRWIERRAIVAKLHAEGATTAQIARELNVTPSRIRQLRKALGL